MRVWPSGWVCHAVRAPGSKVTRAPDARDGSFAWNRWSMRTEPVKYRADPVLEGCEPLRVMIIVCEPCVNPAGCPPAPEEAVASSRRADGEPSTKSDPAA